MTSSPPKLNRDEGRRAYQRIAKPESLAYLCQHLCPSHRCLRVCHPHCDHRGHGEPNLAAEVEGGLALHRYRVPNSPRNLGVSAFWDLSGNGVADFEQHPAFDWNIATRPPDRGHPFGTFNHERAEFYPGVTGTAIERGRSLCTIQISGLGRRWHGGENDRRTIARNSC